MKQGRPACGSPGSQPYPSSLSTDEPRWTRIGTVEGLAKFRSDRLERALVGPVSLDNLLLYRIPAHWPVSAVGFNGHQIGGCLDEGFVNRALGYATAAHAVEEVHHVVGLARGLPPIVAFRNAGSLV